MATARRAQDGRARRGRSARGWHEITPGLASNNPRPERVRRARRDARRIVNGYTSTVERIGCDVTPCHHCLGGREVASRDRIGGGGVRTVAVHHGVP